MHMDVELDNNGIPTSNNSQVPGTPVAIFTFGDDKNLWFQQHYGKKQPVPSTLIQFLQTNGYMFVLDGRDETVRDGKMWYHKSDMINGASVTYSFTCRVVQREVEVDTTTHRLVYPRITAKKAAQHRAGKAAMETKDYKEKVDIVPECLQDCLDRFS